MATYCVGDIHGCYDELQYLLESVNFDSTKDMLWTTGDVIGRGPKPIETLDFLIQNKHCVVSVLGNHDLSLLRNYTLFNLQNSIKEKTIFLDNVKSPELGLIIKQENPYKYIDYLKNCPIAHFDNKRNILLTHAGLSPEWTIEDAIIRARELESELRSPRFEFLMINMFSNKPSNWLELQTNNQTNNISKYIYIINAFTRMRFCDKNNYSLDFLCKDKPTECKNKNLSPWFLLNNERIPSNKTIIFGHWAALEGRSPISNIIALDTGCVWNGYLSMINVDQPKIRHTIKSFTKYKSVK